MAGYDEKGHERGAVRYLFQISEATRGPRIVFRFRKQPSRQPRVYARGTWRVRDMANLIISLRKAHTGGGRCVVKVAEAEVEAEPACPCAHVLTENIDCRHPSRGKGG
jgi:hypothetical protein